MKTRPLCRLLLAPALIALVACGQQASDDTAYHSIRPGEVWLDTNGKPIQAHGFQVFCHDSVYYWYGENKAFTTLGSNVWTWGIRAYRSTDFYKWEDMGLIIPPDTINPTSPLHYSQTLDRPHILHNPRTSKWVCWIKSMDTDGYFVIMQADDFRGPYKYVKSLKPEGFGVGDFDMWCDPETGQGYVWFERPHCELICAELTDDFLGVTDKYSVHFPNQHVPYTREAPSHFVRDGKHYLFTSGTTGYTPNPSRVCVFTDPHGEYTDLGDPHVNDSTASSFCSQITSVIRIPGKKDLYVSLADRWLPQLAGTQIPRRRAQWYAEEFKDHKPFDRDYTTPQVKDKRNMLRNEWETTCNATYVFLPVTFSADGRPTIQWRDEWRLDEFDD